MSTESKLSLVSPSSLATVEERLQEFRAFVKSVLQKGIDYGTVGTAGKATLLKPGAERILQLYNLTPTIIYDAAVEDFRTNPPFIHYRIRVVLVMRGTGEVVGEGVGTCNSMEKKYRSRSEWWPDKKNPPPADEGWVRKNGKWGAGYVREVPNPDVPDLANTILKMAKKRALVDAALTVGAASEFFTQDLEDAEPDALPQRRVSKPSKEAIIDTAPDHRDEGEELEMELQDSITFVKLKKALLEGFEAIPHQQNWLKKHGEELQALPEKAKKELRILYRDAKIGVKHDRSGGAAAGVGGHPQGEAAPKAPEKADGKPQDGMEGHEGGVRQPPLRSLPTGQEGSGI